MTLGKQLEGYCRSSEKEIPIGQTKRGRKEDGYKWVEFGNILEVVSAGHINEVNGKKWKEGWILSLAFQVEGAIV